VIIVVLAFVAGGTLGWLAADALVRKAWPILWALIIGGLATMTLIWVLTASQTQTVIRCLTYVASFFGVNMLSRGVHYWRPHHRSH